jgi:GNAT superfamily N-acetyltransferase
MEETRSRPSKVQVGRLQDRQLDGVVELENQAKQMLVAHGFQPSDVHARTVAEVVRLTKGHNVRVAEADDAVAGYLAWRDESPGVGYVEQLCVHPKFQRFKVGTKLFEAARAEAQDLNLGAMLTRCKAKAPWAQAFYARLGFKPLDAAAPAVVDTWKEEQAAKGPLAAEGEVVLYLAL